MKKSNVFLLFTCTLLGLFTWNKGISQDATEFKLLDKSKFVILNLRINFNHCEILFDQIPEGLAGCRIVFQNQTHGYIHTLEIPFDYPKQISFTMGNSYLNLDTFLISIDNRFDNFLTYVPVKIIVHDGSNTVRLGENCYLLECIPNNDPWMPHVPKPYLFSINDYYLNPKTGRIQRGKKIVNSLLYDACELENFIWINPNRIYTNIKNERYSGNQMIHLKRINIKDWNL